MRRSLFIAALLAAALVAAPARADDDAAATELFNAGLDLMKAGDYAAACPRLAESVRLKPTVGALAKLATCEEHEHHLVSARARWLQALNLARSLGDPRVMEVQDELARIDRVVPKLVCRTKSMLGADAVIRVDDLRVGAASLGVPLAVEPGHHAVTVSVPNKKPWSTTVETRADGATTPVDIPALEDDATPAPIAPAATPSHASVPPRHEPAPEPVSLRVVGFTTVASGVLGVGVGTVLGLQAIRKRADAGCTNGVCPTEASKATFDDAKTVADASTIAFVVGGALVAGGVAMWIFAPPSRPAVARLRVRATPSIGARGGGVFVSGSWD